MDLMQHKVPSGSSSPTDSWLPAGFGLDPGYSSASWIVTAKQGRSGLMQLSQLAISSECVRQYVLCTTAMLLLL